MASQVNNCFFRLLDLSPLVFVLVPDLEKYSNRKQKATRISELVETVDKTMCMFDMHFSNSRTNLLIIKIISVLRTAFFTCLLLGKVILYVQVKEIKSLCNLYYEETLNMITNNQQVLFSFTHFWTLVKIFFFFNLRNNFFDISVLFSVGQYLCSRILLPSYCQMVIMSIWSGKHRDIKIKQELLYKL